MEIQRHGTQIITIRVMYPGRKILLPSINEPLSLLCFSRHLVVIIVPLHHPSEANTLFIWAAVKCDLKQIEKQPGAKVRSSFC